MKIEEEVFKRKKINSKKLVPFGFQKRGEKYYYTKEFMAGTFRAEIEIDSNGKVKGKVMDTELEEEYTNFRLEETIGEFVNTVKEEYIQILKEIAKNCFESEYFIFSQTNRITKLILEKYAAEPEFLWDTAPNYGVFRNPRSEKWFGIIMNIDKSKVVAKESGEIEILNLKLDSLIGKTLKKKGIYPSYHMSKKSWVSIILDDTLSDKEIMDFIAISFESSGVKGEWIVPANPSYYDVIGAFEKNDIILWKQSSNVLVGDLVYLYVAKPYGAILFQCKAIETNIPYEMEDENVFMKKAMKIQLLKKYRPDEFTFKKLNEYGVRAVRGPRSVPDKLSKVLSGEVKS